MDEQVKWFIKLALTTSSLVALLQTGRRRGWL